MSTVLWAGLSGVIAEFVVGHARANQPAGMERENRAAASMHDPARIARLAAAGTRCSLYRIYIRPMSAIAEPSATRPRRAPASCSPSCGR